MAIENAIRAVQCSKKFRGWRKPLETDGFRPPIIQTAVEHHYTPSELGELWGVSAEMIRIIFREEPGVLKIGKPGTKYRRPYVSIRIPESIAEKVYARLST